MKNKKLIDKEIQEAFDHRSDSPNQEDLSFHEDASLYQNVFELLEQKPEIQFGDEFANTIIEVAQRRKWTREIFWKAILYTSVSFLLIAVSIVATLSMDKEIFWEMVVSMKNNADYLLFGGIVFTVIQLLDKFLIKKNLPQAKT